MQPPATELVSSTTHTMNDNYGNREKSVDCQTADHPHESSAHSAHQTDERHGSGENVGQAPVRGFLLSRVSKVAFAIDVKDRRGDTDRDQQYKGSGPRPASEECKRSERSASIAPGSYPKYQKKINTTLWHNTVVHQSS